MVCAPPNLKVGGLGPHGPPPSSYAPVVVSAARPSRGVPKFYGWLRLRLSTAAAETFYGWLRLMNSTAAYGGGSGAY